MVKNYFRLIVALVFATNLMAQNVTHIFPYGGDQLTIDKYGNIFFDSDYSKIACMFDNKIENHSFLWGPKTLKLNCYKKLIGSVEKNLISYNNDTKKMKSQFVSGHEVSKGRESFDLDKNDVFWFDYQA